MSSVKERLKAQIAAEQESLASSSSSVVKETSPVETNTGDKAKLQVLISALSEEQLDRYEAFRRSKFPQAMVRKLVHNMIGVAPSANCCIALSGIAKVLVGQIVEESLDVQSRDLLSANQEGAKDPGPIHPRHVRDAVRRMRNKGLLGFTQHRKQKLKRL